MSSSAGSGKAWKDYITQHAYDDQHMSAQLRLIFIISHDSVGTFIRQKEHNFTYSPLQSRCGIQTEIEQGS